MQLTIPAVRRDGIWFPQQASNDRRADATWSELARQNHIHAAAASPDQDPFSKYPHWIVPLFAGIEGTMLDAGCGYGRVSIPLLKENPRLRCVGVDASPVMLQRFQDLAAVHGVRERAELYCGNLDSLPFPDGHFQAVLSCAVLLHLPKADVLTVLRELRRVLDGKLVLAGSFPNLLTAEGVLKLVSNFNKTRNGPVRAYTRGEVQRMFRDFDNVSIEAHQMTVLPRAVFGDLARSVNRYCSERMLNRRIFVSYHDVIAKHTKPLTRQEAIR